MSDLPKSNPRFPGTRRIWKPVAVTGAGGTAVAVWFEEMMVIAAEIIGVILLAILGGLIILFDHFLFKSHMPRREDLQNNAHKGEKL